MVAWGVVEPGGEADDLLRVGRYGGQVGPPGLGPLVEVFAGVADGAAALPEPAAAVPHGLRGVAGRLTLRLPFGFQCRGEGLGVAGDD